MAGSFSDFLENKILNVYFGATAYAAPATLYLALFTASPTDAGGGTEASGGNYGRLAITNNTTNFPNATGTTPVSKSNGAAFTYPAATWTGTIVSWGLFDAASAGNLIAWADLTASKTVSSGDVVQFDIGNLTITLD
jgi:hypothetical protein